MTARKLRDDSLGARVSYGLLCGTTCPSCACAALCASMWPGVMYERREIRWPWHRPIIPAGRCGNGLRFLEDGEVKIAALLHRGPRAARWRGTAQVVIVTQKVREQDAALPAKGIKVCCARA